MTTDGQPCSAVTVIFEPKDAIGGGHQVVHFVDISTIPVTMSTAMTFMLNGSMQREVQQFRRPSHGESIHVGLFA